MFMSMHHSQLSMVKKLKMNDKQLWKKTSNGCLLVDFSNNNGSTLVNAPNIPIMFWPDESVCWPITMWLMERGKSYIARSNSKGRRNTNGGSSNTHASLISHFVRFIHNNHNKDFTSLYDDDLKVWAKNLKDEIDTKKPYSKKRKNTQVGSIMRSALTFLVWYQKYMLYHDKLIGEEIGNQITISYKAKKGRSRSGKKYQQQYIHHRHIPNSNTPHKVFAIGNVNITKLYDALRVTTSNVQVRKRDECILKLLEATGGRRVEVAEITVEDFKLAMTTERLILRSAKSDTSEREVPIAKQWIEPIARYINTYRKKQVKELIKNSKISADPNSLFINLNNGEKLYETYISKLISNLKKAANINEKICAHMFRHRFITIQVATRLKDFRKGDLPIDVANSILTKVSSLSGHSNPESLRHYIDLAFAELDAWDTADKVLEMRSKLEGAYREMQIIKGELETEKLSKQQLLYRVDSLLADLLSATG